MKLDRDVIIPAIDLATLFIVVLLLAVFAVRYSTKGIGEGSLLQIGPMTPNTEAFLRNPHPPFLAVIIKAQNIDVCRIVGHTKGQLYSFSTPEEFAANIDKNESYVIYEEKKSGFLDAVIRALIKARVATVQIARIAD